MFGCGRGAGFEVTAAAANALLCPAAFCCWGFLAANPVGSCSGCSLMRWHSKKLTMLSRSEACHDKHHSQHICVSLLYLYVLKCTAVYGVMTNKIMCCAVVN